MTRILNLESCVECYQYGQLFKQSTHDMKPKPHQEYPNQYKQFLQEHHAITYIQEPVFAQGCSSELALNPKRVQEVKIGTPLSPGDDFLFIVGDTVGSFKLSQEFVGQRYLYASAYHYWNHIDYFQQINLERAIVFVDLDSFLGGDLVPISFHKCPDNHDFIPLINNRKNSNIQLNFDAATIYDKICREIAAHLLHKSFSLSEPAAITHLSNYLQRIVFFQKIQSLINQENFQLVIEVWQQGRIFYKTVEIEVRQIESLVLKNIQPCLQSLQEIHEQYAVAIISQYNFFHRVRQLFENAGIITLQAGLHNFSKIWNLKQENLQRGQNIPLFGFYLDQLKFKVQIGSNTQWLEIPGEDQTAISYEGQPSTFIGRIPDTGKTSFRISREHRTVTLPIKVNDEDYCVNDIPQDYHIEVINQGIEDIDISIEFRLKPDAPPELLVRDLRGQCKLYANLKDKQKPSTYGYLPLERIEKERQAKADLQVQRLSERFDVQQFSRTLNQLSTFDFRLSQTLDALLQNTSASLDHRELSELCQLLKDLRDQSTQNRLDPLRYIKLTSNIEAVATVKAALAGSVLSRVIQEFPTFLERYGQLLAEYESSNIRLLQHRNRIIHFRNLLDKIFQPSILVTGKMYELSQVLPVTRLFDVNTISTVLQTKSGLENEYFHCLARVAVTPELQSQYFNLFETCYKLDGYIWGYGRVLMWYFDFQLSSDSNQSVNYKKHFGLIAKNLTLQSSNEYQQGAFLALIYLLTYRSKEHNFCRSGSPERNQAEEAIKRFQDKPVKLNEVSREKTLNQIFQELLNGQASEADVECLISAS